MSGRRLYEWGGQILNLVGDDPMVNLVISKLLKNESLCNFGICVVDHIYDSLLSLSPLRCIIGQSKASKRRRTAMSARSDLSLLSVPDVMTHDEMDDFGM